MSRGTNYFDDDFYEPDEIDLGMYKQQVETNRRKRNLKRKKDVNNEVGVAPELSPEILAERERYSNDFIALHREVFPESTGIKPFGEVQQKSILFGQDIFRKGGRLLKLEPRGYAKTTRITNEALFALLAGMQDYIVIVCSNVTKAQEIVDSIRTELMNNEKLLELFPGPIACFRHLDNNPLKSRFQTYNGQHTYIKYEVGTIRFPIIPGEPSSGRFIEIRPLTNLKGLNHKIKAGPDAGKVFRPTLVVFDDPQTHEEAKSPTSVKSIVSMIKRDALKGGSQSRRVSAIMAITPVANGDVAYHFEKIEHSWDVIKYQMMEQRPDAHDTWMNDYAKIYMNYDRTVRGDRHRAAMEARKYVEDNYEMLHKGAIVSWDWAYGWDEDPQTEISAVQHAYNIILDDGWEDFEYECQCNTEYGLYEDGETIHCPPEVILTKINPLPRKKVPQGTLEIVTHIDVNKDYLSYVTVASGDPFRPYIINYGTHPKQPGILSKLNVAVPLRSLYPNVTDYREILYLGVKDLLQTLAHQPFLREDGVELFNSVIGIDVKFEEDYIIRACKDSSLPSLILPTWGIYVSPDEEALHERSYPEGSRPYHNCVERPVRSRTIDYLNVDANYFKTEVHKAFNQTIGLRGSLTMFTPEWVDQHKPIADHCNAERPEREPGRKTNRTRIVWKENRHRADNEYFDNIANCFALLVRQGIDIKPVHSSLKMSKEQQAVDMADYMKSQKGKLL